MPTIQYQNTKLNYEQSGQGPDLLLIAGFTADLSVWRLIMPYLTPYFCVTVLDNRGTGGSDADNINYSIEIMADDVIAVMEHARIESAVIVGHSMGGFILQSLAARYGGRLKKAIFLCSRLLDNPRYALSNEINLVLSSASIDARTLYLSQALFLFGGDYISQSGNIEEFIDYRLSHTQNEAGFQGQKQAIDAFDRLTLLNQLEGNVACAAIYGKEDLIAVPDTADFIQQQIPSIDVRILSGCGHVPQLEKPQELANILRALY